MSTPFADDSLLPQAVPEMPVSPHGRETVLRSERADWERRAAVARDTQEAMEEAQALLKGVIDANYLGKCVEGEQLFGMFQSSVATLADECRSQAIRARVLAEQCRIAGAAIDETDVQGAKDLDA
ncbi:hypothetical protein [Gordonia lacunae]|uniref:ESX-1 secretion-associated protein n=1 Tax=Gordonia lacunae TaxID=417102 RepID=A0A243QDT1_9ACTN|nr:hypothetical protein [Gordonia lacunae]OUC79475.1 hypothetical protein CA982_08475 [Gordonia lacunae]